MKRFDFVYRTLYKIARPGIRGPDKRIFKRGLSSTAEAQLAMIDGAHETKRITPTYVAYCLFIVVHISYSEYIFLYVPFLLYKVYVRNSQTEQSLKLLQVFMVMVITPIIIK